MPASGSAQLNIPAISASPGRPGGMAGTGPGLPGRRVKAYPRAGRPARLSSVTGVPAQSQPGGSPARASSSPRSRAVPVAGPGQPAMNAPWAASRSSQPATGSAGPPLASVSAAAPIQAWWAFTANAAAGARAASQRCAHATWRRLRPAPPRRTGTASFRYPSSRSRAMSAASCLGSAAARAAHVVSCPGSATARAAHEVSCPGSARGSGTPASCVAIRTRPPIRPRYPRYPRYPSLPPQSSPP